MSFAKLRTANGEGSVEAANYNAQGQVVIAGTTL
jgi:[acyl-carrier-protein] S-malonyltransferase